MECLGKVGKLHYVLDIRMNKQLSFDYDSI